MATPASIEEERAFRATVRDRLTEVLRALASDLDLSAFALLQVRLGAKAHDGLCREKAKGRSTRRGSHLPFLQYVPQAPA
jgi:hypothetical protein